MAWRQLALISSVSAASLELHGSTFRIVHVSDAHYHSAQEACRDATPSSYPCTHANTTAFLRSVIALEQPHMVAFTGDMIDEASGPRPREGMDDMYALAIELGLPWAASLGNHEDVVPGMTRDVIYDYILGLPGRALSAHGPIATSPGNFYVDLNSGGRAVARLVFFDSRNDDRFVNASTHSITDAQARPRTHPPCRSTHLHMPVHTLHASPCASAQPSPRNTPHHTGRSSTGSSMYRPRCVRCPPSPSTTYRSRSIRSPSPPGLRSAGACARRCAPTRHASTRQASTLDPPRPQRAALFQICADKPNPRTFDVLKAGGVVGGFCGHDHTNDFCAEWQGVQLCYEGSPGFGAYGSCQGTTCYQRRARVTELALTPDGSAVATIRSWKRLDGGGSVAGPMIDDELLWARESLVWPDREPAFGGVFGASSIAPLRMPVSAAEAAGLVRKKQPAVRPAEERSPVALVTLSLVAAASLSAYVVQHCRRQPAVDPRRRRLVEMKAGSSSSDPKCRPV